MPSKPDSFSANQHAYIPQAAQAAMSQQMQRGMPAHLQKYMGPNKPAYVPERVQREITTHMQKAMPSHLQQYAGAYVQQNIVTPGLHPATAAPATPSRGPAPIPDKLNRSHSGDVGAEQYNAQFLNLFQTDSNGVAAEPAQASAPSESTSPPSQVPYDFIMNPQQPKRPGLFSFVGSSTLSRVLVASLGFIVLLIIFAGVKNILSGSDTSIPNLVKIAQDQQELVHLATTGSQSATSSDLKNFSITLQLSLASEQRDIVNYLSTNGQKVDTKELALKVSKTTDDQLTSALGAGTFDATYKSVMQTQLTTYQAALQSAFNQTKGPKGRSLLSADYKAAQLLAKQLGS